MSNISRREWAKLSLSSMAGVLLAPSLSCSLQSCAAQGNKVIIGVQTYSFRNMDLDAAIKAMQQLGISNCELWNGHIEPYEFRWREDATPEELQKNAEGLKKWRATITMDKIEAIGKKIRDAGITIQSCNGKFNRNFSQQDIELMFKIARALGTDTITTSTTTDQVVRIDPFAQQYKIKVGLHNHDHIEDPDQFATPESFMRSMEGASDYICINLDLGHFTAANFDPVDFMKKHHKKIVSVHVKDRKKDHGPAVPFGKGDTPLAEALQLIRDNAWPIACHVEYEYDGADAVTEVRKCIDYCNKVLG
ncbi:MAG: sugar phosphate isomerase/epimerase [Niabella sp.]